MCSENDMVYPSESHLETESLRLNFIKGLFKIKQSQTPSPLSLTLSTLTHLHSHSVKFSSSTKTRALSINLNSTYIYSATLPFNIHNLLQFSQVCFSSPKPTFEVHFLCTSFNCFCRDTILLRPNKDVGLAYERSLTI